MPGIIRRVIGEEKESFYMENLVMCLLGKLIAICELCMLAIAF